MNRNTLHLLSRAGFGPSPSDWRTLENSEPGALFEQMVRRVENSKVLLSNPYIATAPEELPQMMRKEEYKDVQDPVMGETHLWMMRMVSTEEPDLLERMTLFWHDHFACRAFTGPHAVAYLNVLRQHGLGNFKDLVRAVARTPAMIRYLDNESNKVDAPNENFARELMELFTIGRGYYTENDVKEAARAFTGWGGTRDGEFKFRKWLHDEGEKEFMGKRGKLSGDDIIDRLLERPETARFIVRKLYRYFINDIIDEQQVNQWAEVFYTDYEILPLLRRMFLSEHFYEPQNVGTKIKSPLDLIVGILRQFEVTTDNARGTNLLQRYLGQYLFRPPNVAGWPAGRFWINNATLALRMILPTGIAGETMPRYFDRSKLDRSFRYFKGEGNIESLLSLTKGFSTQDRFEYLSNYLLGNYAWKNNRSVEAAILKGPSTEPDFNVALHLMSLPEYQMV